LLGWLLRAVLVAIVGAGVARLTTGSGSLALWDASRGVQVIGWLLLAGGALITEAAQRQMGNSWRAGIDNRPTALVTAGIFRFVRNPIFSGFLLFLAGYACLMPAWSIGLWVATALGLRIQTAYEEQHLVRLHGQAYLTYAARAGRFVPLLGRLREPPRSIENHGCL
jgi:protein-S-isoprenylcysteine O-methyltransferase Ste14